jgi:hypothetical protein
MNITTEYEFKLPSGERAIVTADTIEDACFEVLGALGVSLLSSKTLPPPKPEPISSAIDFAARAEAMRRDKKYKH